MKLGRVEPLAETAGMSDREAISAELDQFATRVDDIRHIRAQE
jgi:hypothetical protein